MRTDIHSPTNFDPAAYTYVGSFDQYPEPGAFLNRSANPWDDYETDFGTVRAMTPEHAEYLGGRNLLDEKGAHIHYGPEVGQDCDHCGARIRYVSIFRHTFGQHIAVGTDCANQRFSCDSRRSYDIKRLKERAASTKERAAAFGKADTFVQEACPELTDWLLTPAAETVGPIFADIARKLIRFGSLSEKQVNFCRKLLREYYERQRNGGKTDREVSWAEEKAKALDCPEGRTVVTGTVVKTEVRDTDYGTQYKMVVKDDRGFAVWSSIPAALLLVEDGENQRGLVKGDRITFTATLQPSDKDSKFGFGSRPSKASVVSLAKIPATV